MNLTYRKVVEVQSELLSLNSVKLPIKSSIALARFSNQVDDAIKIFTKVRDNLIKDYQVKPAHEGENVLSFTIEDNSTQESKKLKLTEFSNKFFDLLDSSAGDFNYTITLPSTFNIEYNKMKILFQFIEVEDGN